MSDLVHARVVERLVKLRLGHVAVRLDAMLSNAARNEPTYLDFMDQLLDEEVQSKQKKRVQMGIQIAHFPSVKALDDFEFKFQPSVDERLVKELATGRFVANAENVLLFGPPGVGRGGTAEGTAALRDLPKTEGAMNDAEIIMSAPGFAEHTTGVLLAEAGAVLARRDSLELRAVCGVAPVTKSSGKRRTKSKWTKNQNVDGVVVMRRAVNMRLRNAVHHAGNTASRDPRFAPMYARLRASGANHARAVRGVADRLLGVLIGMLRTQTLYQPAATTT